jgi:hypothetical protein
MLSIKFISKKKAVSTSFITLAAIAFTLAVPGGVSAHFYSAAQEIYPSTAAEFSSKDQRAQQALQHHVMSLLRSLGTDNPDIEAVRQIKRIRSSADDLLQRIPDRRPSDVSDADRPFFNGIRSLRIQYGVLTDKIASSYPIDEPASILNSVSTLESLTNRATTEEMTATFKVAIPRRVKALEARIFAYQTLVSGKMVYRPEVIAKAKQQISATLEAASSFSSEIIESNELPQDVYSGRDKVQIQQIGTNALLERFPNKRVIDIVLTEKEWESQVAWEWIDQSWQMSSTSQLRAVAVVHGDGEDQAWLIPILFSRNQSTLGDIVCRLPEKMERPDLSGIIPLSKAARLAGRPL